MKNVNYMISKYHTKPNKIQGTWIHRKVAYNLAQWISSSFAVQVSKILDELFECAGGKEYCLKQIISQHDYKKFIVKYVSENKQIIYDKIKQTYTDDNKFDMQKIIELEISETCWNKYIMKLYYFDTENLFIFEYSVKTEKIIQIPFFNDEFENKHSYANTFLTKIKNGMKLWNSVEKRICDIDETKKGNK